MRASLRSIGAICLAAGLLAVGLGACTGSDDASSPAAALEAIRARGALRVAVYEDKPPFSYVDSEGRHQGFDVELARRLAKDIFNDESKVEYVIAKAQDRIAMLDSGAVDVMLANFTRTPERAEKVDFALPYMKTSLGIVAPKAKPIAKLEDLDGKKVVVVGGTTSDQYFTQNHPKVELLRFDHDREAFQALIDGEAVALAQDSTLLYAFVRMKKDFVVSIDGIGAADVIAPAVKKGSVGLLAWLNGEIRQLYNEKFFFEDFDKSIRPFYGDDIAADAVVISE